MDPMVTKLFTQTVQAINPCGTGEKRHAVSHAVNAMRLCITPSMMKNKKQDEKPRMHLKRKVILNIQFSCSYMLNKTTIREPIEQLPDGVANS